eukprot:g5126.t1
MNLQLSNPFAALEVRKTKKKKQSENEKKKHGGSKHNRNLRLEEEIFGKAQSNVSNWADAEDDDWAADHSTETVGHDGSNGRDPVHESEEEEIDMEEIFGVELGPEDEIEETEKPTNSEEPTEDELTLLEEHRKKYQAQPQRTLSKKELKKKEMEDFDNMLAGFGIDVKQQDDDRSQEIISKKKKKKNKDKLTNDDQPVPQSQQQIEQEVSETEESEAKVSTEQIKTRIEKASKSLKKRTTSKKSVEIAAAEAKARNKGKKGKKDATHYNQAPNH